MTDTDFVLSQLERGPQTTMMLISASIRDRGCGLTPHSRVADLRRDGYDVRCERSDSVNGRPVYVYTLVSEPGPSGVSQRRHGPSAAVVAGRGAEIPALPDENPEIPGQLRLVG